MKTNAVVNISVTRNTKFPAQAGFNVALLVGYFTNTTERLTGPFADAAEVEDAGYPEHVVRKAGLIFGQSPRPDKIMIGRRANVYTQTVRLTPVSVAVGFIYKFDFYTPDGVAHAFSYTVQTGDTVADICDEIVAVIDPLTDVSATDNTTSVDIAATAGKVFWIDGLTAPANMKVQDRTTDPGIAADLSAIEAIDDSKSWYAIFLDRAGEAEINAAAAWVETRVKLLSTEISDWGVQDAGTTDDVASDLHGNNYDRTLLTYVSNRLESGISAAILGRMLPFDPPGSANWAHQEVKGVKADDNTTASETATTDKKANVYTDLGGSGAFLWGTVASGEYIDIITGIDWVSARIQEAVLGVLKSAAARGSKVPYNALGIELLVAAARGVLLQAEKVNFINAGWTVTATPAEDQADADKAARLYQGFSWDAVLSGAINKVRMRGNFSL